jgi:hypothetical protein
MKHQPGVRWKQNSVVLNGIAHGAGVQMHADDDAILVSTSCIFGRCKQLGLALLARTGAWIDLKKKDKLGRRFRSA